MGLWDHSLFLWLSFPFPPGFLSVTLLDDMLPALTTGLKARLGTKLKQAFLLVSWFPSVFGCMNEQAANMQTRLIQWSSAPQHPLHQALMSYKSHLFLHFFFISLFFHVECGGGGGTHTDHDQQVGRQHGSWEANWGHQAYWQVPGPAEPSLWPDFYSS